MYSCGYGLCSYIFFVRGETMVDASRQNDHVVLLQPDAHPVVVLAAHVKVAGAVADVSDLLVLVQMFVEEGFYFVFVHGAHGVRRHGDLVSVLVVTLFGDGVDRRHFGAVIVQNAQAGEVRGLDVVAGIVAEALVALFSMSVCRPGFAEKVRTWMGWQGIPLRCRTSMPSFL